MKQTKDWLKEFVGVACEEVGHKQDHRFRPWAKVITSVNRGGTTGYAFNGNFVGEGTTEMEVEPCVILVKTSSGSMKYQTQYYSVLLMNEYGEVKATDIQTDDRERGWALRIRDAIADLVDLCKNQEPSTLNKIKALLPSLTEDEIIATALERYYDYTRKVLGAYGSA